MIIVVEGPDKAGKTTFISELTIAAYTHARGTVISLRRGPIKDDVMTEYLRPFDVLLDANHRTTLILDRWHVGELIYGPLLRGQSALTEAQSAYIEMVMNSLGCVFIHMTAHPRVLEDRWDTDPDTLIKRESLGPISDSYWRYVQSHPHWVNMTSPFANTEHFLRTLPWDTTSSIFPGRYIGPKQPKILLLGDVRANRDFMWPFVPRRATSGHWLMDAILSARINIMDIGIINACERSTTELEVLWNLLRQPPVVTLGRNAEGAWRKTDAAQLVSTAYLHHPQYQRRFHYTSMEEYGQQIKDWMR